MNKPLPPTYFLAALVLAVVLHFVLPVYRFWSLPLSLLGVMPLALGIVLNLIADGHFKRGETTVNPFEQPAALITAFPFSISRNPMYLGMVLMLLGVGLLLGSVTALLPTLLFPFVMNLAFIQEEERMMAATFGAGWDDYRAKVRRWI